MCVGAEPRELCETDIWKDWNVGHVEFTDNAPGQPAREHARSGWGGARLGLAAPTPPAAPERRTITPGEGSAPSAGDRRRAGLLRGITCVAYQPALVGVAGG